MAFDYANKIQSLIAKAESEAELGNAKAAAAYQAKAETMMREYRIAEEDLIATDQFAATAGMETVTLMESYVWGNPLRQYYVEMFSNIARYAGVRFETEVGYGDDDTDKRTHLVAKVVGYPGDIALAKFLWTSARLVFLTRIDTKVNPVISDQENCYYMRNSGMKRNDIANKLWSSAYNDGHAHGKVQRLYLAECATRGEKPRVAGRGIQVSIYRDAYAREFVYQFGYRLAAARDAVDVSGGGLVLHGRKERVDAAFYAAFPHRAPETEEQKAARLVREAIWKEQEANCEDCAKTKSETRKCRRHRPYTVTESDRRRWARQYDSPEARAGSRNGRAAAQDVNVERGFSRNTATDAPAERDAIAS